MSESNGLGWGYEDASRFQECFKPFLSASDDIEECGHLAHFLYMRWVVNGSPDPIHRREALNSISDFKRCLTFISKYWLVDESHLHLEPPTIDNVHALLEAVRSIRKLGSSIDDLCDAVSADVKERPNAADRINWRAVEAVSALRSLWTVMKSKDAPSRALNPSSNFANFLRAGFKYLNVEADAVSAFKRWAAVAPSSEKERVIDPR